MNRMRRMRCVPALFAALLAGNLLLPQSSASAAILQPPIEGVDDSIYQLVDDEELNYSDYYDAHREDFTPDAEFFISGDDFSSAKGGSFSVGELGGKENVLIWDSAEGELSYTFSVPESGKYSIAMTYYAMASPSGNVQLTLFLDSFASEAGENAFLDVTLNKIYVNKSEIKTDSRGNQVRPSQVEQPAWQTKYLYEEGGLYNDPLQFYLEEGKHTLTLTGVKANIGIESIRFGQKPAPAAYHAPSEEELSATPSTLLRIEGEAAKTKSSAALCPAYDNSSYTVSPSDPVKMVYNTIGGASWDQNGSTITWEIPAEALKGDGWYRIGIKARQNVMRGFYSNRRILIDGELPNDAFGQIKFYYDPDWSLTEVKAGEEAAYVYLTAGQTHTITLEAMPGEIGESMRMLERAVKDLNQCYKEILMITGPNPDKYNDYYVEESVPNLLDDFARLSALLKQSQKDIETLSGSLGSEAAALQRMVVILDKCMEKPSRIPSYVVQMQYELSSISTFIGDYRDQPLEVDYLEIASPDRSFSSLKSNFFKQLLFRFRAFLGSFTEDTTTLSDLDPDDEDVIEVWVNLGRDQALVVKELVESQFQQEHPDIPVAVNLVSGGVVEATLAGKGPDIALFLGGEFPVNLACRGLLADLTQFPDYEETVKPMQEKATVQYAYEGGVYGIPLTQSWTMMFYRSDILKELGITMLPRTWDELIDTLPGLQRNHLGIGLILPQTNAAAATEAGHTFATLVLQSGLNYYNPEQTRTQFDNVKAIQCFEKWTDFYTDYKFTQVYDAYSYFRSGQYPIVIANYSFYNQLETAAPEIKGLWNFTVMPGTLREDGTLNHASNSSGTAAVIFNQVKNKENAWEFVKWFASTEIQTEYGRELEGLLGQMGRYETANIEALKGLNWSAAELKLLEQQWASLDEIPVLPASYAVTRNVMNAFRETVNAGENPRDTLMFYNTDMNEEILRKRENLGLDTNGEGGSSNGESSE